MATGKRITIFLLLGVIVLGLAISGCAPEAKEPLHVLDQSYIDGCTYASVTKSFADSAMHYMQGETIKAFFDTFLTGIELTDDGDRIKQAGNDGSGGGLPFQICFCREEGNVLVCFYENGAVTVTCEGGKHYASVRDNEVNLETVKEWLREEEAL